MNNTAGYFSEPPAEDAHLYERRADGKWYFKDALEHAVASCATPHVRNIVEVNGIEVELNPLEPDISNYNFKPGDIVHVGALNSKERGSAARYNGDKPPMNFIPLEQQLAVFHKNPNIKCMWPVLINLARFEMGQGEMLQVMDLLTAADLIEASYVWQYGSEKYAAFNWMKGMAWSVPLACISRHMMAVLTGEEIDPESHYSHWAHIVCNILMLAHYEDYYKEGDDRPPKEMFL